MSDLASARHAFALPESVNPCAAVAGQILDCAARSLLLLHEACQFGPYRNREISVHGFNALRITISRLTDIPIVALSTSNILEWKFYPAGAGCDVLRKTQLYLQRPNRGCLERRGNLNWAEAVK